MSDELRHAADAIPVYRGSDGRAYISCDDAVALLRAIAHTTHQEQP